MTYNENEPSRVTGQPFPPDAKTAAGSCQGAFCQGAPAVVARCLVGETYRTAGLIDLCADCLADFAIVNTAVPAGFDKVVVIDFPDGKAKATTLPRFRVWAEAEDGLFHEVVGDLP